MAGTCVEKIEHSCGSRSGLQVFVQDDGSYNGHCFACGVYVDDPYGDKPVGYKPPAPIKKSVEQIQLEIQEVQECGVQDLPDRKLRKETLQYFGYKIGVSQTDGVTPAILHRPYTLDGRLRSYKNKVIETKQTWSVGDQREVDLFGWEQAKATGAKRLLITEGEEDAAALWQILKDKNRGTKWADYDPAVVSLPHGSASAVRDLSRLLPKIQKIFKEVVLVFDMDKAGQDAATSVVQKVCGDWYVASLPEKDANACLVAGKSKACAKEVLFDAAPNKNSKIVWGESLHEKAKEPAKFGVSWPWKKITDMTRGIRKGETIYLGAAQKMGKSEVVNAVGAHLMKEHGWAILMAKPEEANAKTYKMVAGKMVNRIFHDPKVAFDEQAYDEAGKMMSGKLAMLNLYQHMGWETLKGDIKAAVAEGVEAVFIDPITNMTNGMSPSDANTKLQEIAQELAAMALDLNIVVFIFCHLRNPDGGLPHDRGGKVLTGQFAGSRAMGRSCNYMFGLEGNKDPDIDPEQRNMRKLVLLDDREFGEVGSCDLYWDRNTTQFNEVVV